jgi:hypothetical protein
VNYFQLRNDMTVRDRWNLGAIMLPGGTEPQLEDGVFYEELAVPSVSVTHTGRVLDFSLTSFNVPIASLPIAELVRTIAKSDVQVVPVIVAGQPSMAALNVTKDDHRADVAGTYRQVTKLVLDRALIPTDAHFFLVGGWEVAFVVSESLKTAIEHLSVTGAEFTSVTADD